MVECFCSMFLIKTWSFGSTDQSSKNWQKSGDDWSQSSDNRVEIVGLFVEREASTSKNEGIGFMATKLNWTLFRQWDVLGSLALACSGEHLIHRDRSHQLLPSSVPVGSPIWTETCIIIAVKPPTHPTPDKYIWATSRQHRKLKFGFEALFNQSMSTS